MIRIAPVALALAGAILLAPVAPALAMSTEDEPTGSDGSSQIADPNQAIDQFANPSSGTEGDATIEMPPLVMPGDDSNDYVSPDADDGPAADVPSDGSGN